MKSKIFNFFLRQDYVFLGYFHNTSASIELHGANNLLGFAFHFFDFLNPKVISFIFTLVAIFCFIKLKCMVQFFGTYFFSSLLLILGSISSVLIDGTFDVGRYIINLLPVVTFFSIYYVTVIIEVLFGRRND